MDFLPFFQPPSLSASSGREMEDCSLRRLLNSWVAFRGLRSPVANPQMNPPKVTYDAQLGKRLQGEYGWMGNLLHDLFERSLYAHADRMKGRSGVLSQAALNEELQQRFTRGWLGSRELTLSDFKRNQATLSKEDRPVWLTPHALPHLEGRLVDVDCDERMQSQRRQWMNSAAFVINEHLQTLIENSKPSAWVYIEGKELSDGDVVSDGTLSQQDLRATNALPSFWVSVDGRPIEVFCTIDFAYQRDGGLVLADLKTGREKAELHLRQLELYGLFAVRQRNIDPSRITVRLMYPQNPNKEWIREFKFDESRLVAAQERLEADARRVLDSYVPLSDEEVTFEQLSFTFSPYDAEHLAALGTFKRTGSWPHGVDPTLVVKYLIATLSPPELVKAFESRYPAGKEILPRAVARAQAGGGWLSYEKVNYELLRILLPTQGLEDFLSALSVEKMLVPLSTRFTQNEAASWVEREKTRGQTGGVPSFPSCMSCQFSWFCEPGREAIRRC